MITSARIASVTSRPASPATGTSLPLPANVERADLASQIWSRSTSGAAPGLAPTGLYAPDFGSFHSDASLK